MSYTSVIQFLKKHIFWLLILNITISCDSSPVDSIDLAAESNHLGIIIGISIEEYASFFNGSLRENDIVFTYVAKLNLLQEISGPQISIGRQSIFDLQVDLERLDSLTLNFVNYNPEQSDSSHTTQEELDDLFAAINEARALATAYNAQLSFGTDQVLLELYGTEIAPLVDLFGVQMMRYQTDSSDIFLDEMQKNINIVRSGDLLVPIYIQLAFNPPIWERKIGPNGEIIRIPIINEDGTKMTTQFTAEKVLSQIYLVKDFADGIALLYSDETKEEMKKLIRLLRE